ncbi:MAG: hypothetical protein V3U92_01595 [Cellulophaga sp.]
MTHKPKKLVKSCMAFFFAMSLMTSCSSDDSPTDKEEQETEEKQIFTLALGDGSTGSSKTYVQGQTDLSTGSFSFSGFGFEVPSTRTARIFASKDRKSLFDLDYGGGRVYKFDNKGGDSYTKVAEINVEFAMGTAYPRITKANDETALLHAVNTEISTDEAGEYTGHVSTIRLMSIELENFGIGAVEQFILPKSGKDEGTNDYVNRIDSPIIVNGKAYYGMAKRGYNATTDEREDATYPNMETLVVDYPSLTNPKIISSEVEGARGSTNGYRTPASHVDEKGDIYQINSVWDGAYNTHILKISNGDYVNSYDFNLSELLGGIKTASLGWFYVGNGIGYVPYAKADEGSPYRDSIWEVARVDLYNNTAVTINLPDDLWLTQYQSGVIVDGKFYMAITPKGQSGNIYMFDPANTTADGATKGAALEAGADQFYIGIY